MERSAEREVIDVLQGFCAGFADRDADTVMRLVGSGVDLVVVTSEHSVSAGQESSGTSSISTSMGPTRIHGSGLGTTSRLQNRLRGSSPRGPRRPRAEIALHGTPTG
jgi:hypothetical protein